MLYAGERRAAFPLALSSTGGLPCQRAARLILRTRANSHPAAARFQCEALSRGAAMQLQIVGGPNGPEVKLVGDDGGSVADSFASDDKQQALLDRLAAAVLQAGHYPKFPDSPRPPL
jgi:hypothetical protein